MHVINHWNVSQTISTIILTLFDWKNVLEIQSFVNATHNTRARQSSKQACTLIKQTSSQRRVLHCS